MPDDSSPDAPGGETVAVELDTLPAPDMRAVRAALQRKALKECWVCGDNRWSLPPGTNMVPAGVGRDGKADMALNFQVVTMICKSCGFVRMHHVGRLLA